MAEQLFVRGAVVEMAREYVISCVAAGDGGRFPNLAGFACRLGIGLAALEALGGQFPQAYDMLLAILEDGALNAEHIPADSATLTVDYFRRRLGYDGNRETTGQSGTVQVIFEHNILGDGQ